MNEDIATETCADVRSIFGGPNRSSGFMGALNSL